GFTYKMFNNKLRVTVSAANFLSKYIDYRSTFRDENFYQFTNSQYRSRSIGCSVRWNFGKLTDNVSRKRGVSNDDIK
ncbi:MAG TPA: outer membrane beta-barrel protein, partial [Segetibacter sp.]